MIHLKPIEGLFAIEVPMDTCKFRLWSENYLTYQLQIKNKYSVVDRYFNVGFFFRVIGTITKDSISFDCCPLVETDIDISSNKRHELVKETMFKDYEDDMFSTIITSEQSFRSILSANGIFLSNTLGEKEPEFIDNKEDGDELEDWAFSVLRWKQAQAKVLDKVVIIKQVK